MEAPSTGLSLEMLVFAGVLGLILLAMPFVIHFADSGAKLRKKARRLSERAHRGQSKAVASEQGGKQSLRIQEGDSSLPLLTSLMAKLRSSRALRNKLAQSGMDITAERYMAYNVLLFLITTLLISLFMGKGWLFSILVGIVVGMGLPHLIINFKIGRQQKRFLLLFPDAIDLIVRGLRAGLPVTESMKMVAKEIEAPVGTVFTTIAEKMALGIPLEKTLYDTAKKYRITELDFFVTSIVLQRETGGNLSEILANLSEALRQRLMMRLKIKAMSSEARASMYIIGALPLVVMLALQFISPEYLQVLFQDFRGNIALGIAGGMLATGIFIMLRMAKFEI